MHDNMSQKLIEVERARDAAFALLSVLLPTNKEN
jgi:hypothetical protein